MIRHEIIIKNLPKVSLNKWYAGAHWTVRNNIKNTYKLMLNKYKPFSKSGAYDVEVNFEFKTRPLDASNCAAMYKLIEDCLFEDDAYSIVLSVKLSSKKGVENKVVLIVTENDERINKM